MYEVNKVEIKNSLKWHSEIFNDLRFQMLDMFSKFGYKFKKLFVFKKWYYKLFQNIKLIFNIVFML